ncbi:hypothetical protein DPMN_050902 [Dreissena polymorpha]|uniref:Uncharacterized protein n=1 Tax=Dreissena polymorpha TaxID=45954 RepID=A0A9D4CGZ1_DREPO|nr:hypothetical protein DPMN_050902 [Dreissena polymorpha]
MQRLAGELAYKLGKRSSDKPLSNCCLYSFLKRWGDRVTSLKPSSLETTRAKATTPEHIGASFENLEKAVALHMLQDRPELIYNMDETGISPEHRPPNIIVPTKEKTHAVTSPRSASTKVIAAAHAAGAFIPPYFVFKGSV